MGEYPGTRTKSRRYQKVRWVHDRRDEPVALFSEIDNTNREIRRVEQFIDGRMQLAGPGVQTGTTRVADDAILQLDQINSKPVFGGWRISASQFEEAWNQAMLRLLQGA